jgi:hypothetical protein
VIIDDRVDHRMRHSEPVESEKDVLNVFHVHHLRIVIGVNEVDVVRQPTDPEDQNKNHQHLHNLKIVFLGYSVI